MKEKRKEGFFSSSSDKISCSAKGSHVLQEILSEDELKKPSLRFSFSKYNTKEELDYTILVLKEFAEG